MLHAITLSLLTQSQVELFCNCHRCYMLSHCQCLLNRKWNGPVIVIDVDEPFLTLRLFLFFFHRPHARTSLLPQHGVETTTRHGVDDVKTAPSVVGFAAVGRRFQHPLAVRVHVPRRRADPVPPRPAPLAYTRRPERAFRIS